MQDGAAVRVSVVGFDDGSEHLKMLDGKIAKEINADLSHSSDLTVAKRLRENIGISFEGVKPAGPFDIPEAQALEWLDMPNPEGLSNREVLRLYINGRDITDKPSNRWIVDFNQMPLEKAQMYIAPFAFVETEVKPIREKNNEKATRENWWKHKRTVPAMKKQILSLERYLVTVKVAKHRAFTWLPKHALPSDRLIIFAFDSDFEYGLLNSQAHTHWATKAGGTLEDRPFYTSTTCFETFPFPHPTLEQRQAIEKAAVYLETVRTHLKSKELTLTEMYNALEKYRAAPSPTHMAFSLHKAHESLDVTVCAAYGWDGVPSKEEMLERLLALNLERAAAQGEVSVVDTEE